MLSLCGACYFANVCQPVREGRMLTLDERRAPCAINVDARTGLLKSEPSDPPFVTVKIRRAKRRANTIRAKRRGKRS